jgi:hypothetical protein
MIEFTQFDQINPLTGEGYPTGEQPPPGNESATAPRQNTWEAKYHKAEVTKKIVGLTDAVLSPAEPGNPALAVSIFDTTSYLDRATIQFYNDTGAPSELGNFAIKGKIVYMLSGEGTGRVWNYTDYGDVEKRGEKEYKVANDFMASNAHLEDVGDYLKKELKPHDMYTLALRGWHPYFDEGDLWTLTISHTMPTGTSEQELVDIDVRICGVSCQKTVGGIGETILSVRVPSGAWSKSTSTRARLAVSGLPNQDLSRTNMVTIAPFDNPDQADYHCTGTNDELVINSALAKVGSEGAGKVQLLKGNYYVSLVSASAYAILMDFDNVSLVGEGCGATIIHFDASANSTSNVVYLNDIENAMVDNLSINITGTYASTRGAGVYVYQGSNVHISHNVIIGGYQGIETSATTGAYIYTNKITLSGSAPKAIISSANNISENDIEITTTADAMGINGGATSKNISNNSISIIGDGATGQLFGIYMSQYHTKGTISGNTIVFSGTVASSGSTKITVAIYLWDGTNTVCFGNNITFSGTWTCAASVYGVYVSGDNNCGNGNMITFTGTWSCSASVNPIAVAGSYNTIVGNRIIGDDFNGAPNSRGIYVTATYNSISNNNITNMTNTGAGTGYGISLAAGANYNNVCGNINTSCDTEINDLGTGNTLTGNT